MTPEKGFDLRTVGWVPYFLEKLEEKTLSSSQKIRLRYLKWSPFLRSSVQKDKKGLESNLFIDSVKKETNLVHNNYLLTYSLTHSLTYLLTYLLYLLTYLLLTYLLTYSLTYLLTHLLT